MIFGIMFAFWRFLEIITLIPTMGMLAYFVHIYASNNALTPTYILVLFIVSVLGVVWTIFTIFTYHRSNNARFVALVDLLFVGALIGGVYELRGITHQNCTHVTSGDSYQISLGILGSVDVNGLHFSADKQCSMLKACFAFGIMNCIFFFITAIMAWAHGGRDEKERTTYVKETHVSRHGQRRSSGSHRSHRSTSRRGAYV